MRLLGFEITRPKAPAKTNPSSDWQLRPNDGQGPYTTYFRNFIPRKIEASFYEFLREAIPIIDTAIERLVSLDGHIIVKGDNEELVDEIQEWMYNVPVNDIQKGMQAFHQNISNEAFEQGFGIGEFVVNKQRTDIIGLRVADSKWIKFKRTNIGLEIYQKADTDLQERPLKPDNLLYFSINNENQNPYGTPKFRSCEFVSKVLVTMDNALLNVWERFGDPSFSIIYKTTKRDGVDLEARRQKIETEFNAAIRAKREGKSADFIRAIDKDSDITIKVIGHEGQTLEIEIPARHIEEQIVGKSGLPSWMLARHWSTTERLSDSEGEMLLADVSTRQAAKMPLFFNLIRNLLLLRGRTWKKGDWRLEWAQVNLRDILKQAQARFMNAQADMYYLQNASAAGIEININDLAIGKSAINIKPYPNEHACRLEDPNKYDRIRRENNKFGDGIHAIWGIKEGEPVELQAIRFNKEKYTVEEAKKWLKDHSFKCKLFEPATGERNVIARSRETKQSQCSCGQKELSRPTPWPELDKVENDFEKELIYEWNVLKEKVILILKLNEIKADQSKQDLPNLDTFNFSPEQRAMIMQSYKDWLGTFDIKDENSPVTWYYGQAYSLGLIQAVKLISKDRPILDILKNREIFDELCKNGFQLLKDNATKAIIEKILPAIEAHIIAGSNPRQIASVLEKLFEDKNSDWERLARTEISSAAERAKLDEWSEWGVKKVEFTPAPDACYICVALAGEYNVGECPIPGTGTHPRCRCSIRPAASEV